MTLLAAWLTAMLSAACGPPAASPVEVGLGPYPHAGPDALAIYRELGYVVGDRLFAVVGRFVYLPEPADSTYAIFVLSLPNNALRFRREPPGFLARYQVDIVVGDSMTTFAHLEASEEVRVSTFRETSRRRESVVFQGFLKLLPGSLVYFETASPAPAIIQVLDEGEVVWSKDVTPPHEPVALHATIASIDLGELPPGDLRLQVRLDAGAETAARLLVTPSPDWLFANYQDLISYLRYAGRAGELDSLRSAPVRERARQFAMFWKSRDPDPATPENEFFERYFRRIQDANNRFADQTTEGWLTDRGAVYVTVGPPDEVFRHLDQQEGPGRSQIWLYNRSLGFELRLVFVDETGVSAYSLTRDSRLSFLEAVERLYS